MRSFVCLKYLILVFTLFVGFVNESHAGGLSHLSLRTWTSLIHCFEGLSFWKVEPVKLSDTILKPILTNTLTLSASSGLVVIGERLYVIGDDQMALFVYSFLGEEKAIIQLFEGTLPSDPRDRKKKKKDFEALIHLQDLRFGADGALLVLPSGSKEKRLKGAVVEGFGQGRPSVKHVDFSRLYEKIEKHLGASLPKRLNIEGVAIVGETIRLFHRGNGKYGDNFIIDLDYKKFKDYLFDTDHLDLQEIIKSTEKIPLGHLDGVPLSFSDASRISGPLRNKELEDLIFFTASAEASKDAIADGPVKGSVLGVMSAEGKVLKLFKVDGVFKIEGVSVSASLDEKTLFFRFVTDADDPNQKSNLLRVSVPTERILTSS